MGTTCWCDESLYRGEAGFTTEDMERVLCEGSEDAHHILMEARGVFGEKYCFFILTLEAKHLYGARIVEVYREVCGRNIHRFIYHLEMELPCQFCGSFFPYGAIWRPTLETRTELFTHQIPRTTLAVGANWALKHPPTSPEYDFPLEVPVSSKELREVLQEAVRRYGPEPWKPGG